MQIINFSKENFFMLMKWVFIPVSVMVVIVGLIALIYKKVSKNTNRTNRMIDFFTSLLAIVVTSLLLVIVVSFAISFIETMRERNLIEANKLIYYLILFIPIIPFSFLVYCIVKFAKTIALGKEDEISTKEEQPQESITQEMQNTTVVQNEQIPQPPIAQPVNNSNEGFVIATDQQKEDEIELL